MATGASGSCRNRSSPLLTKSSIEAYGAAPSHPAAAIDRCEDQIAAAASGTAGTAGTIAAHRGYRGRAPTIRRTRDPLWSPVSERLLGDLSLERDCRVVCGHAAGTRLGQREPLPAPFRGIMGCG